ncbi:MAG: DUF2878 family protein [Bdellovibrionales bacterium]|nr:DUF2878 family protein [Bdellovibrionales bacterium]
MNVINWASQFLISIGLVIVITDNRFKLLALTLFWLVSFSRKGTRREAVFFVVTAVIFTFANFGALNNGVFRFRDSDILLMPWNELLMWGFYGLNSWRVVGGEVYDGVDRISSILLAVVFAVSFSVIRDERLLASALLCVLVVALFRYHAKRDLMYVAYFAFMGLVVEGYGLHFGYLWYPKTQYASLPLWGPLMWLNIGWIMSRLGAPLIAEPSRLGVQKAQLDRSWFSRK